MAKKKEKKQVIAKTSLDILPIRFYDDVDAFLLKNNEYLDVLQILPRDLNNISDDEIKMEMYNFVKILKTIACDYNLISINFPLNTINQREILEHHQEKVQDETRRIWIDRKINELELADSNITTLNFYFLFWGKNKKDFIKTKDEVLKYLTGGIRPLAQEIAKNEKIQVISKLSNMNTTIDLYDEKYPGEEIKTLNSARTGFLEDDRLEEETIKTTKKRKKKQTKKEEFDINLIETIQSKGGLSFKEPTYTIFGDGYVRCLHIDEIPTHVNDYWLIDIFNIPNTVCSISLSNKDIAEVKKNINKSIMEENARGYSAKNYIDLYNADKRKQELQFLFDELARMGEVIKLCDFRIFVKGKTLAEMEEKCSEIIKNLDSEGYKITTLLNEQNKEIKSLYNPYSNIHSDFFTMKGLSLTTETISSGYPFNYSELLDKEGTLMGFSDTGGVIIFDEFTKTKKRKHYNSIVCGDMGSGKSTHLKKRFTHNASIGNFVRTFDISGEFKKLTNEFGGKIIKCNGKDGMLNPLEILKAGDDDTTSFSRHISKLQAFFKCIMPSMGDTLLQDLSNILWGFYGEFNLLPSENRNITGLDANKYPTFSQFKNYLEYKIKTIQKRDALAETDVETELNIEEAKNLNSIFIVVNNLCSNYGHMFDGHTTINNITNEKIVTFDISEIKDLGNFFTACMQDLVSLCWDNAVDNGIKMKTKWENEDVSSQDLTKFLILIDESHRWVNTSMPLILDMILKYMREARKYFAGITLASQSVRDFMPQSDGKGFESIKKLFELSQYKFMFKQDSSAKEHIRNIFGESITFSQVEQIPFLEVGECILAISGDKSLKFKEWLSKEYEEKLFAGGR